MYRVNRRRPFTVDGDTLRGCSVLSFCGPQPYRNNADSPAVTVLTIRARKSDVDAFSKDDLDFDEFRKRIRTSTYQQISEKTGCNQFILKKSRY